MVSIESTVEGLIVIALEDLTDLPAPIEVEEGYSSNEEEFCEEDYEGELMSEETSALDSDWIGKIKKIDKQKMATMLYDNYIHKKNGNVKDTSCKGSRIVFQCE